jgi:signal transduction histidine kinase
LHKEPCRRLPRAVDSGAYPLQVEVKYTPEGGQVTLKIGCSGPDSYDVVVRIPPELQPHIFDRFVCADSSRSAGGSGAGPGSGY